MPKCSHCGSEAAAEAVFCESCGKPIEKMEMSAADTISSEAANMQKSLDEVTSKPIDDRETKREAPVEDDFTKPFGVAIQGAPGAAGVLKPAVACQAGCPVRLEANAARFYVEGFGGPLEFRLENSSTKTLEKVQVDVDCPYVEGYKMTVARGIMPGASRVLKMQCRFSEAAKGGVRCVGQNIVGFLVGIESGGTRRTYRGEWEILVLQKPETPQQMLINIQDAVHVEGEKGAMGGAINVPINISRDVASGAIQDINMLLRQLHGTPPEWREIALYLDDETSLAEESALSGARTISRRAKGQNRLRLDIDCSGKMKRVLLIAKPEVQFGRSRRKNDVSLILLPRNPANDEKSRLVTAERHFAVSLDETGLKLADASTHGTVVDGKLHKGDCCAVPKKAMEVSPGHALTLRFTPCGFKAGFSAGDYMALARGKLFHMAAQSGMTGLRIDRMDNFHEEMYALVYAGVTLGDSAVAGIPVEGTGLSPRHLLILYLGDGFYVENISGGPVDLNGKLLAQGKVEPLAPGDKIEAGDMEIRVGDFEHLRPGE